MEKYQGVTSSLMNRRDSSMLECAPPGVNAIDLSAGPGSNLATGRQSHPRHALLVQSSTYFRGQK